MTVVFLSPPRDNHKKENDVVPGKNDLLVGRMWWVFSNYVIVFSLLW